MIGTKSSTGGYLTDNLSDFFGRIRLHALTSRQQPADHDAKVLDDQ
jgi:hypothetical protein